MVDVLNQLMPLPTKDQIEAERKREKREKLMSAIGDGIMSLSNLFYTAKGAPNAFNHQQGMSAATQARWDKLKAEREKRRDAYLNAYFAAAKMDADARERERSWQYRSGRDQVEDARYERNENRAQRQHELQMQLQRGQITAQEYQNKIAELNLRNAPTKIELENEELRAANAARRAGTQQTQEQTRGLQRQNSGHYVVGGETFYDQQRAMERARYLAEQLGVGLYETVEGPNGPMAREKPLGQLMAEISQQQNSDRRTPSSQSQPTNTAGGITTASNS